MKTTPTAPTTTNTSYTLTKKTADYDKSVNFYLYEYTANKSDVAITYMSQPHYGTHLEVPHPTHSYTAWVLPCGLSQWGVMSARQIWAALVAAGWKVLP